MDLSVYYREQDERMNMPDEEIEEYLSRIGARRSRETVFIAHSPMHKTSRSLSGHWLEENEHTMARMGRMDDVNHFSAKSAEKKVQTVARNAFKPIMSKAESPKPSTSIDQVIIVKPESPAGSPDEIMQKPLLETRKRKTPEMQGEETTPHKKLILQVPDQAQQDNKKVSPIRITPLSSNPHMKLASLPPPVSSLPWEGIGNLPQKDMSSASNDASLLDQTILSPFRTRSLPPSNPRIKATAFEDTMPQSPSYMNADSYGPVETTEEGMTSKFEASSDLSSSSSEKLASTSNDPGASSVLPLGSPVPHRDISHDGDDNSSRSEPSSPAYVPTHLSPATPKRTSPRKLKRKNFQDIGLSSAQRQRNGPSTSLPLTSFVEEIEEITSFNTSPISKPKTIPPRVPPKAKPKAKNVSSRNMPALPLKSIVPPLAQIISHDHDPPTSPIEEITVDGALKAAPSKLYLEVKQRIAAHTSARRKDKLIKLPPKPTTTKPGNVTDDDDSSIIYVSSASSSPRPSSPPNEATGSAKSSSKHPQPSSSKPINRKEKEKAKTKTAKSKKEKPPPVSPEEYAQMIIDKAKAKMAGVVNALIPAAKFLHGMNIFYTGGDMTYASERTRGRMHIIVRHGANLLPRYNASITTHIVTDASIPATLRALGLKDLSEIPNHIPTVKWEWIVVALSRLPSMAKDGTKVRMDEPFLHAAFFQRIDAGKELRPLAKVAGKGKAKAKPQISPKNMEFSHISDFTQDRPRHVRSTSIRSMHDLHDSEDEDERGDSSHEVPLSPSSSPLRSGWARRPASSSKARSEGLSNNKDPLAEFYAKARAEADTEWARPGEALESEAPPSDSDIEEPFVRSGPPQKRGWTCDTKEVQRKTCANQNIIDKLEELKALHAAKLGDDDRWRVFSYSKCIRALRNHPKPITSFAEARAIRGVGEKTAAKIMEIIETGGLRRIGYETTDDIKTTKIFQGVYGVGQSTAYQWYAAGCRSLADVVAGKGVVKLTPAQEIGIHFYDALKIDPKLFVEIMGSYRRGKADCGDIDILITRPPDDGKTHEGVLSTLLSRLHLAGILTEDLALPEEPDDLEAIYRGLCRIPHREGSKRRRIDFLTVPWASRGAALLYYTGDDIFNRAIRMKAGVLGYSLNQKGLFAGVVRDPRDRRVKLNAGTMIASETEEEIFRILKVPWQEPHERVRG